MDYCNKNGNMKRALFIVNVQTDFCNLVVPFGDRVVPVINKLIDSERFDVVIASKDSISDIHPKLKMKNVSIFTKKHNHKSGIDYINEENFSVEKYFKNNNIDEVYMVGLSGDYHVKEIAKDCSVFFKTYFVVDATRFIGDMTSVLEELAIDGVIVTNSDDCLNHYLSDEKYYTKNKERKNPFIISD